MPTFDTPRPILVDVELGVGDVRITAGDRNDTTVEVRPSDPAKQSDVDAAAQTRVDYTDGRLVIRAPKGWRRYTIRGGGESVDVRIEVPSGSQIRGDAGIAGLHAAGPIGECEYKTGVGDIQVEQAGPVHLSTGVGDIAAQRVSQHAEIHTGSGSVRTRLCGWHRGGQGCERRHVGRLRSRATSASPPPTARSSSTTRTAVSSRRPPTAMSASATSAAAASLRIQRSAKWRLGFGKVLPPGST